MLKLLSGNQLNNPYIINNREIVEKLGGPCPSNADNENISEYLKML